MKVIAKTAATVLVEMTPTEFRHCFDTDVYHGGEIYREMDNIVIGKEFNTLGLSQHLIELRNQHPDLKQLRGVMQAFLALTEPEAIEKTLEAAGVPVRLKKHADSEAVPA